jgi:hypothetical protein
MGGSVPHFVLSSRPKQPQMPPVIVLISQNAGRINRISGSWDCFPDIQPYIDGFI